MATLMVRWKIKYFDTTLEEYKVVYPNRTSNYITKDDFDYVKVILLSLNVLKKYKPSLF